jgi:5-methylcytosine-specific restriction endonuclease McrA
VTVARDEKRAMSVLVLNASYEPLHVVSVRRAVVLLLTEKAQIVEAADALLRSERLVVPRPLVIRLVAYIRIPRRWQPPVSRRAVLARDGYACQYCGAQPGRAALTIDHVVPRSQGGGKTWDNLVTACMPCNRRKGGRRPHEVGMHLLAPPAPPRYIALAMIEAGPSHAVWDKYLEPYRPLRATTATA